MEDIMETSKNITFEQVDEDIKRVNSSIFSYDLDETSPTSDEKTLNEILQVCQIYGVVRPILILFSELSLIPLRWKALLRIFIQSMDTVCPVKSL